MGIKAATDAYACLLSHGSPAGQSVLGKTVRKPTIKKFWKQRRKVISRLKRSSIAGKKIT
jgi:hypothetical protein